MSSRNSVRATRRWSSLAGLAVLVIGIEPASADPATSPASQQTDPTVRMIRFAFDPPTLTVEAGTSVTWTYDESTTDLVPNCESPVFQLVPAVACPGHSTTSSTTGGDGQPLWDSGLHRADGFPFTYTFTTPGIYPYYCVVHGGPNPNNPLTAMNGTIVVTAAASPGTTLASTAAPAPAPHPQGAGPSLALADSGGRRAFALGLALLGGAFAVGQLRRRAASGTAPNGGG